jgi:hypothetical protein
MFFAPSKKPPRAQNMKTGHDVLGNFENDSGSAKHENGTRHPRFHQTRVRERKTWLLDSTPSVQPKMSHGAQNMQTKPDALGTAQNGSGCAKHETGPGSLGIAPNEFESAKH